MASGFAISVPKPGKHWDQDRRKRLALYVEVRFDALMNPQTEGVLPLSRLKGHGLDSVHWTTQSSGISIEPRAAAALESLWRSFLLEKGQSPANLPEEIPASSPYHEGASRMIAVNAYERDPRARRVCIDHYGTTCCVCGFDFAAVYGPMGEGLIHVHHLIPLSEIGRRYAIDPVCDLRPVCPNCHAMLHKQSNVMSVVELRKIVRRQKTSTL